MYVIVGANGYLGAYMIKNILSMTDEEILAVAHHKASFGMDAPRVRWTACDITNVEQVCALNERYLRPSPCNKVVYLAAYHHPDLVEKNPRVAWNINVTSLSNFLNTAENVKCLFYPSTDSVYGEGGREHAFRETDALNPANRYGRQKCAAEALVTAYGYHVARFPFLIAPSLVPGKPHFYDRIVESITAGVPFDMFKDSYRSSLDFGTASKLVIQMMEAEKHDLPAIVNVCGDDALSKYDVGLMIADHVGVSRDMIRPISIQRDVEIFQAKRACSTVMDNSLLKRILELREIKLTLDG